MPDYDIVIIGGAAMGSATAYHLALLDESARIVVVEKDPTYEYSSTMRCEGNLRIQFNLEENIRMSQYTMELVDDFADAMAIGDWRPDLTPHRQGNLFLTDEAGAEAARSGMALQQSLGCEVEWLDAAEIARRWPLLEAVGIVGGTLGPHDGFIDPSALMHGYRRNALRRGVEYLEAEAIAIEVEGDRIAGVRLTSGDRLAAPVVVNCAGGWATALAATAGIAIPVEPVMRKVYLVDTPHRTAGLPFVLLPNGIYARAEGDTSFEMGWSRPSDPVGFDFTFSRAGFSESIWPELIQVLPRFDELSVFGGWRGVYAMNTLDHNAIVGEWPTLRGYYMANGFSGHGFQHTPAMGRYLAELVTGAEITLDLTRLGPQRILDRAPLREHAGRII